MTGLTVTYSVKTWKERHGRLVMTEGSARGATPVAPVRTTAQTRRTRTSKAARVLALAHHIERLIDGGVLLDYADAARRLDVSRVRVSQIVALLNLPIPIQHAVLSNGADRYVRDLRSDAANPFWSVTWT